MSQLLLMYSDLGWMHKRIIQNSYFNMLIHCRSKKNIKKLPLTLNRTLDFDYVYVYFGYK